jgi:hypothetical protein
VAAAGSAAGTVAGAGVAGGGADAATALSGGFDAAGEDAGVDLGAHATTTIVAASDAKTSDLIG